MFKKLILVTVGLLFIVMCLSFYFTYVGSYNCSVTENFHGLLKNCTVAAHDKDFGPLNYTIANSEVRYVNT